MDKDMTLDSIEIVFDDLIQPITSIIFIMKSGAQITVDTPLSTKDFVELYNRVGSKVKIITGANSQAMICKPDVAFYHTFPIKK